MSRLLLVVSIVFNINNIYGAAPPGDYDGGFVEHEISPASEFISRNLLDTCSATISLPGQSSTYNHQQHVRGYYFQAPTTFAITGITIPTDASTGTSTAAVVRFNSQAPPPYSQWTNDFVTLGRWVERTEATIDTGCICVNNGDHIGVLGYRGGINSYANAPHTTSIDGNSVTVFRLLMQYSLITNEPKELSRVDTSYISRVPFTYTTCPATCPCLGNVQCTDDSQCTDLNTVCNANGECVCDAGYTLQNDVCVDVNECVDPALNVCDPNATCQNTAGSYICQCNAGYRDISPDPTQPGTSCEDYDECLEEIDNDCGINAICINLPGTFECVCDEGHVGDPTDECVCRDDIECKIDDDCPLCNPQCCPKRKVCETRTYPAMSMFGAVDQVHSVSDVGVTGYGNILLVGIILFILVNNIFIGCWCLRRQSGVQAKTYEKCANVVIDDE